ncbi:MAG: peptidylprolyl isomerase [Bacteroidales bacterium]|nr:peptidylprolyl isomerase [Bacteroidales bacterium]
MNSFHRYFTLLLLFTLAGVSASAQKETVIDKVVAVVGQNIIKMSDVEQNYKQIRIKQGYANAFENRCNVLESMLITKLLVHKGMVDSVEVGDEEVEAEVQRRMKPYEQQYGSNEAVKQATGYEFDQLHDILFDLVHDGYLSMRVQYNLTESVKITPAEVAAYYNKIPADSLPTLEDEYELSEIVLKPEVSEAERDKVKLELARLRERILAGEKFGMLATLYSQDPASSTKGGELGFFSRGEMVAEFEAAAFALKPGEVSPIIETQYGFHILQLIERRGNTVNVRHILMTPKVSAEDMLKARIRLDSIVQQIRLGNITFEEAAKTYSDASSKTLGGVLNNPYTLSNRFSKEMISELYPGVGIAGMDEGDISNALAMKDDENKDLFRVVKLTKHIPSHTANLEMDYDKIYNAALQEAKNNKVLDWASKMIKNTYIYIAEEYRTCPFQLQWVQNEE